VQPDPVDVSEIAFHLVLLAALKKALSNIARDGTLAPSFRIERSNVGASIGVAGPVLQAR
jgi:hypothetical protein